MYKRTVILINEKGLDEQLALDIVNRAAKFESKIDIKEAGKDKAVNAKSIIRVVGLGLKQGKEIELSAIGEDEIEAIDILADLVGHSTSSLSSRK